MRRKEDGPGKRHVHATLFRPMQQDAINSDTLAIDFEHPNGKSTSSAAGASRTAEEEPPGPTTTDLAGHTPTAKPASVQTKTDGRNPALAPYDFDTYEGRLYRVFEGTVLEGVVTTHIDGGFNGSIMLISTETLRLKGRNPKGLNIIRRSSAKSIGEVFVSAWKNWSPFGA